MLVITMDMDEIMGKVYARASKEDRIDEALSSYVDILTEYGDNSQEEKKMYSVGVTIFPELKVSFDITKSLKAGMDKGELDKGKLSNSKTVESALQKAGLKE